MSRKVVLIGHCGPDSGSLRVAVTAAVRDAQVLFADDEESLQKALSSGADLLLVNRIVEWGFHEQAGTDLIRRLKQSHPSLKMMLVSNYEDAQAEAVQAGALPGFGKRDLGTPRVTLVLRNALA